MRYLRRLNLCICGGGSQAHALAAVFGANPAVRVSVLTRQPASWQRVITAEYLNKSLIVGKIQRVSADPAEVVATADLVLLAVPACARGEVMARLSPHLPPRVWLGCVPGFGGFAWQARKLLGKGPRLFGFQRVPFVCHKLSYGERVAISGVRAKHCLGAHPAGGAAVIAQLLRHFGHLYTVPMGHYLNVCLSRSNSILNPSRLYSLFSHWPKRSLSAALFRREFYRHWDKEATVILGEIDDEMRRAAIRLPLDLAYAVPVLQHYEVATLSAVTARIRGLRPLWGRPVPVLRSSAGLVPDVASAYFTEDIPYGLVMLKAIFELAGTVTPTIDKVITWAQQLMGREYLLGGGIRGRDAKSLPIPQQCGLQTLDSLIGFCLEL